ncbi:hypothetical protein Poli38472_003036 [Pythium oligandrum]|uniref:WW domain-containing protein n=1 Tax=Pythium oligandrum TaxID=41045 RepID=A0A8K1C5T0_PYTOL|nr:hypothetical protein Poli38472_003036 [Pythium oligandrum]|eukprot:TMW57111.1 hypothetical protein Poli38472_003036 [Pythium oligandrum]
MMTAESTRKEANERPKWEVYSDEYGNFYFYNTLTGESTWELPTEEENVTVDEAETSVGAVLDEDTAIRPVEGVVERAKASYTDYDIAAGVIDTMLTLVRRVEETAKQQSDAAIKPKKKRFVSPAAEVRYKKNQAKHEKTQKREHLLAMTRYMNLLAPPVTSDPTDAKPRQVGALFSKEDAFRWRLEKEVEQIRQRYQTRQKREKHHKQVYARVSQGKFLHVLRTELLKHLLAQITCSSELQQQRILLLSSPQYTAELEIKRKQQMEPEILERYEQEQTQALEASIKNIRRVFLLVDDAGVGSVHLLQILFAMVSEEGIRKYATQVHGLQTLIESIDIQRFILDFTSKQRTDECMLTPKDFQAFAGLVEDVVTHFASVKEAVNEAEDEIAGAIEASSAVGGSFMRTRLDMASKKKLAQELASLKATHDEMVANQRNQILSAFYGEGPSLLASKEEWEKHHQHRYIQHEAWLPMYCCLCRRRKWELWRRQLEEHEADHRSTWGSQRILKLKSEQLRVANQEDDTAITQPERLKPASAVATISEDCEAPLLEDEALLTEFTKTQAISEDDMVVAEVLKTIVILIDQMHEHQQPVSPPPRVHVRSAKQIQTSVSRKKKRKKSKKDLADEMDQVQRLMTIFDNEERERKTMHTEDVQMCILLERDRRSTEKPLLQIQDMAHNAYIKTLSHCVNPFPSLFRLQFERCLSFEPPQRLVLLVTDGGVCEPDMSAPSRYYILRTVPCRTEQEGAFVFNSNRLVQDKRVTQKELFQAASQNDFAAVRDYLQVLLDENADGDSKGMVKYLLEPKTRNTLLHYACDNGNLDACKYLLMCEGMVEASLNEPNVFGHTPLFYAASSGKLPLVKWLISNGADIDMDYSDHEDIQPRDDDHGMFTPLQIACFKGYEDIVNFFVECNAALSGTRRNGKTPLHVASSQNHKAIVKILMEAGADIHACDDQGKTPVDVAHSSLLSVLIPGEHGVAGDDEDADDGIEKNRDDDDDDDSFASSSEHSAAIEIVRSAFGRQIAREFHNKSWKSRMNAINDASIFVQNGSNGKNVTKLFDASCQMIILALQDAVSQVASSCCTALLKTAFTAVMGIADFHSARFHQDRPAINRIAELLLVRGAGSNEKEASEAVASLLFLICKSADITRHLTSHIFQIMGPAGSISTVALSPSKSIDVSSSSGSLSWRLQLVAIKILNTIASQYRLDQGVGGLSFQDGVKISTTSLENASVHVRTAAIDLFVQCLLIRCEQSDMSGTVDDIYEQIKNWSEAIFKQQNQTLKPSVQAKINNGLKNALQKSKRLHLAGAGEQGSEPKEPKANICMLDFTGAKPASPRSKVGAQKEDDLPYAEPIQDQYKEEAASVQACFGEKVTRCLFSNAWAPRVEALCFVQFQVESKCLTFDSKPMPQQLLQAIQKTLLLALQDRVNHVYEAGVALLGEVAIAVNNAVSIPSERSHFQDLVRPLIPRLLTRLGDSKARLHVTTEDALLLLSRQTNSLGPEYILEEMIGCDRNASPQSLSPTYLTNKLSVISKLLLEFGVKEASDGNGNLSIKHILQPALQVFEHRDPNVRQVALQIIADTLQATRVATMPFLDALARASRQKIISKLVEKGVLEADMLMDEIDDFDISPPETSRPGTSGGIRPLTASGSSTKHRPALSNPSLSASLSGSTGSSANSAQGPALPYGTALTSDQKVIYAPIIQCFSEELVRCLVDKVWAQREAAVREIERLIVCTANGKLPADNAVPKTIETLRILSQIVEMGLNDTVARVFQCTLRLCQLIATDFVPLVGSGDSSMNEFLESTVQAALQKFGDTKQRLRADCFTLLHSLSSLNHVGQARMCRILNTKYEQLVETSATAAASPLIGVELFKLYAVLLRDGYTAPTLASRPAVAPIMSSLLPAFENKHVDVRNAAIDTYITIYELTNGGADAKDVDLQGFITQVKPAIREVITRKVVQISKSLPKCGTEDIDTARGGESARQQPLALDINKLKHICSSEITDLLTSALPVQRCSGVDKLLQSFTEAPRNPHFKGAWEISCLLAKQLLLDGTSTVCLAAFELLRALVDPAVPSAEYAIPWNEWGVQLILSSTIRSVIQQSANTCVRVRVQVKSLLQLVTTKSNIGKNAVCNAILSAPEQKDLSNEPVKRLRKIALCRLRWQMTMRLELVYEIMSESANNASIAQSSGAAPLNRRKSSSSGSKAGDSLNIENVVPFLGSCVIHPSALVRSAARKIMSILKTTRLEELTKFVQDECSPSLQRRLQTLLSDDEDEDNNYADHFSAEDTTVVRGSRASHVRRVAALRPPRSVPTEEKSMAVDVFPPPHSAPGKSRRSLHTEESSPDFGDYVVQSRDESRQTKDKASTPQVPIWLDQSSSRKSSNSSYSDPHHSKYNQYDSPESMGMAVGGGAANLVKVRRKSSMRSNNGEDDDGCASNPRKAVR